MAEHMNLGQRFAYHPPITDGIRIAHETVRSNCRSLASIFERELPSGREKSLAVTKIEEAMFWANAAIARHQNEGQEDGAPGPCHGDACRHVSHQEDTAAGAVTLSPAAVTAFAELLAAGDDAAVAAGLRDYIRPPGQQT